jgi:hypothetical protein
MKTKIKKILAICFFVAIGINCQNSKNQFQEIIQEQIQRYPQMQIQDLYKLVYQAAMGNIHLGVDPKILKNYLINELEKIDVTENEPLIEEISEQRMIRVNLRPYKARGGDPDRLFEAMMETANAFHPDKKKILQYWKIIERMAQQNSIPFHKGELDSFLKKMKEANFSAVHHSKEYSEKYKPAYRVILKKYLPVL